MSEDKKLTALHQILYGAKDLTGKPVTVELTRNYLQRLTFISEQDNLLSTLNFVCQKELRMPIKGREEPSIFEVGKKYKAKSLYGGAIYMFDKDMNSQRMGISEVGDYFVLHLTPQRQEALDTLIEKRLAYRKQKLLNLTASFLKGDDFQIGDQVTWKEGLRDNSVRPFDDEPATVLELIAEPKTLRDSKENLGKTDAGAVHDMVIGVLDIDDRLMHFVVDSRRFKKI